MAWSATLNSSSTEVIVSRQVLSITYRTDIYPIESISCRTWVENTYEFAALSVGSVEIIKVSTDSKSYEVSNTILGSSDPAAIVNLFAEARVGSAGGGGGGGTATTPAAIASGIDTSLDVEAIKTLLTGIRTELVNTTAIADLLVQDSSVIPRYFVRQDRIDQSTGLITVSILNLDGSAPNPAIVLPLLPVKADSANLINEDLYVAIADGTDYSIGDSVANVRILNGDTGAIGVSTWYNVSTRSPISITPASSNLKGYEDRLEELLAASVITSTSLDSKVPALVAQTDTLVAPAQTTGIFPRAFNGVTWDRIRAGISGAVSSVLGYTNTINVGRYNATPPLLNNGQWINTQLDCNGSTKVVGSGYNSKATITRAADTNTYIANDVYGATFELTNFGSRGGSVILSSVRIVFNISSLPAGMGNFLLFLYDGIPPSAVTDNNAFSVPSIDRSALLTPGGGIEIGSAKLEPGGGTVGLKADNLNLQFKLGDNQTSVWGYLITTSNGFTPANFSETAQITVATLGT